MTRRERLLLHQIHPAKLATDVATSFASTWLLWQGEWATAAAVAFVPSMVVTVVLVAWADLDRLRRTPLGRYVSAHMSGRMQAVRSAGQVLMWAGAAVHVLWVVPFGFMVIVWGWLNGLWAPSAVGSVRS